MCDVCSTPSVPLASDRYFMEVHSDKNLEEKRQDSSVGSDETNDSVDSSG